jgi:hypothetical protein
MRAPLILMSAIFLVVLFVYCETEARDAPHSPADLKFTESPRQPANPPEIGASMFQAAAANTVTLGWWQFDGAGGVPDKQGWTEQDVSTQAAKYFHVAGAPGGCDAIAPVNGMKSMWCGRWSATGDPWCSWAALPGYGNNWDQFLESTANASTVTYTIAWETEPGYDYVYVEWWDPAYWWGWRRDPNANGGAGEFDGAGGPLTETLTSPAGSTRVRFRFVSDDSYSDEDGLAPTVEGAVKFDDLTLDGGAVEDWEEEACGALQSADGKWVAAVTPGFGNLAALHNGASVVQEDPCFRQRSWLWGFFDDPASTDYGCGGWPLQGAVPYHRSYEKAELYIDNEIWSPWVSISGTGSQFLLEFLTYRDLSLDGMIFYRWQVRTRDNDTGGCPTAWMDGGYSAYYGAQKDWYRARFDFGGLVSVGADEVQVALGVFDGCRFWYCFNEECHSHAPLFDQVRVLHVEAYGPLWTVRDIDLWQDNFPELGGVSAASYARCDMAQDILPSNRQNILPGDSLKIVVTDPAGLANDNTGGRTDTKAVYMFVRVTDRFGNPVAGKNGLALQSPDVKRYAGDATGFLRYPFVAGLAPAGWDAYRLDLAKTVSGTAVKDAYCGDLMDLAAGPDGPPYHQNENWAANTGIFSPGDVVHYFFGAKNTLNQWSYWHRTLDGQGTARRTNAIAEAMASPCEWSVLPDAGRTNGSDILLVDDADDRGGPAQLYFDNAFMYLGIEDRVDRFDVLGPSSVVGNSLAGRVKNIQAQIIGAGAAQVIYQKVLWNSTDLSRGLMGDGGTPNGGSSYEKSDDFGLCYTFLNTHPDNPGWAYWGDDAVQDWNTLAGTSAVNVKSVYMNHTLVSGDQKTVSGILSPRIFPANPAPPAGYLQPIESFYAQGGCPAINDFDVPGQSGLSSVSHRYTNGTTGQTAALSQPTPNAAGSTARFFLAGFGYDFIRDDDAVPPPDYVNHLREILLWMQNDIDPATGIDPVAFANSLGNAYPNPFNPATTIRYSIASAGRVSLRIYNAAGQLVRTLVDEKQSPAAPGFSVTWDGTDNRGQGVSSGVYFYKLTAKEFSETKKMVFLK